MQPAPPPVSYSWPNLTPGQAGVATIVRYTADPTQLQHPAAASPPRKAGLNGARKRSIGRFGLVLSLSQASRCASTVPMGRDMSTHVAHERELAPNGAHLGPKRRSKVYFLDKLNLESAVNRKK